MHIPPFSSLAVESEVTPLDDGGTLGEGGTLSDSDSDFSTIDSESGSIPITGSSAT